MNLIRAGALLLAITSQVICQQVIDVSSKDAVLNASTSAMFILQLYYDANKDGKGAWLDLYADGSLGVPWPESGQYWNFYYDHFKQSGDLTWKPFADSQLKLSAQQDYSFRPAKDLLWWALASMTAAENNADLFHLGVAEIMFDWVWNQYWDPATCGGGVTPGNLTAAFSVKNTLSNTQMFELGSRLFRMTKSSVYKEKADQIYAWLKSSGIIGPSYVVYGGTQISSILAGGCSVNTEIFSHHAGELLAGLSTMYQSTNDIYYLSEAHEVFAAIQNQFTSSESINIEPACQGGTPQDSKKCPSPSGYYWPLYKGLTILYQATFRSDIQNSIARLIQTSARTNFALCRPDWNCMRNMGPSFGNVLRDGTNVRDQFESVALLNALAALNNGPSATVMPTQTSAATRTADKGNGSGFSPVPPTVYIGSAVIAALVLVIFTGFAIYAKLNKPPNYLDESFGLPDDPTPFLINSK